MDGEKEIEGAKVRGRVDGETGRKKWMSEFDEKKQQAAVAVAERCWASLETARRSLL